MDAILATNDNFLLSKWIGEAKSWSSSPSEAAFLEYQARNQISEYHSLLAALTHSLTFLTSSYLGNRVDISLATQSLREVRPRS